MGGVWGLDSGLRNVRLRALVLAGRCDGVLDGVRRLCWRAIALFNEGKKKGNRERSGMSVLNVSDGLWESWWMDRTVWL